MLCKVLVLSFLATVAVALDCGGLNDGVYYIGCKAYAVCTNGVLTEKQCDPGKVFNNVTKSCDLEKNVASPCGLHRNCANVPDGSYADRELQCKSYYTCSHHVYFGHNFCTPGTVFEESLGTCVWPDNAYAPCGNLAVSTG